MSSQEKCIELKHFTTTGKGRRHDRNHSVVLS